MGNKQISDRRTRISERVVIFFFFLQDSDFQKEKVINNRPLHRRTVISDRRMLTETRASIRKDERQQHRTNWKATGRNPIPF
jgi:hypothetical protein